MIPFFKALNIVMQNVVRLQGERIDFTEALGRVIAENIFSDLNMPPFNKSAMDGFACKKTDLGNELEIVEIIPAGKNPLKRIEEGQAARIMTGAMVPHGADAIFMIEQAEVDGNHVRFTGSDTSPNICKQGEDIRKGDLIIKTGTRLGPQHIACLAAVGAVKPLVYQQPNVGIISTGDELVEPSYIPHGPQIRNSNAYQLMAQVKHAGGIPQYEGIARDTEEDLMRLIMNSLSKNHVVLLSGGVSLGDFDHVPGVIKDLGFEILVSSIAIQPGKPTLFAKKNDKFIFGLPGNPVSSFVLFELLVKPFLNLMADDIDVPEMLSLYAGADFRRKKTDRLGVIPVRIIDGKAYPVEYHGSAHINAYSVADGMAMIAAGKQEVREGDLIDVRQL